MQKKTAAHDGATRRRFRPIDENQSEGGRKDPPSEVFFIKHYSCNL